VADLAAAFSEIRASLTATLLELDDGAWRAPIPTRREWSVKDTVGMLTGFAQAIVDGCWTQDYSDSWADGGMRERLNEIFDGWVAARRESSMIEILAEWEAYAPRLQRMIAREDPFPPGTHPFTAWTYLWAVVQNAHNVWTALGIGAKERDGEATWLCLETAIYWLDMRLQAKGLPALRLRAGEREWVVGDGIPVTTVTAPPFELFRALSGRRSMQQIQSFSWDGDAAGHLEVFSPFDPPKEAIVE
jgi:hypothetical protein